MWKLNEICGNCGHTFSSHYVGNKSQPYSICPTAITNFTWKYSTKTIFKPTGTYKGLTNDCIKHAQYNKFGY